jgi:hypothetical protein
MGHSSYSLTPRPSIEELEAAGTAGRGLAGPLGGLGRFGRFRLKTCRTFWELQFTF